MSPSVNGRHTGTIPRTTTQNGSTQRETAALRRQQHRSDVPNNLVPHDSRYSSTITHHNQRHTQKASNTRIDSLEQGPVDCSTSGPSHSSQVDDLQGNWSVRNFLRGIMNRQEATTSHNMVPESESKSNISKSDRSQVVARLNQIRDYIQQTTTLMDALKASGDPRQEAQRQKLSGMVEELRDSEAKLQSLADKLERAERRLEQCERQQNGSETGSCASSTRSHSNSLERERRSTSLVRASATAKHNELKLMVEESQRKLQALQEHQAALVALQQKAKEQLQKAKAAQSTVLAIESAGPTTDQPQSNTDVLRDVQNLQQRLSVLHEFYDNRNQIVELLGERDEALLSEHSELQDKLTELQTKKRHMDQLLAQFSALNSADAQDDAVDTCSVDGGSSNAIDAEVEQVQNRMAELSSLKTQLAQLQNVVASLHRRDSTSADRDDAEQIESPQESDLAVNLCVRNKPDNISSEGERERARDIQNKAMKLQEARARLQHLQQLLATVVDYQSSGQTVPQHYLDQLAQETASEDGGKEAPTHDCASELTSQADHERHSFERAPVKEKRTNTQADAQRLQARRRELEQLMQKDQGQLSSVNQSEPGYCVGDASTSNATWGNSTQITLEDLDDGRAGFSSDDNLCEASSDPPAISTRNTRLGCSNRKDALEHNSSFSNRDAVDMSLDSNNTSAPVRPNSQNIWRKTSSGSNNIPPRAVWTPSSQHCNVAEDIGSTTNFGTNHDGEANSTNHSNYNSWQHALLLEQQQQQQQNQQQQQLSASGYYQQLWAASQVQQQQALLTTVNQCCQMLWAQQREIAALRAAVATLQQERPGSRSTTQHQLTNELLAESVTLQNVKPGHEVSGSGAGLLTDSVTSAHSLPNLVAPSTALMNPLPLPIPQPTPPTVARSPPALNNQVPPGNRANNYWDNFRSYSRQNLLSTTKTNEVSSDRSRNSLHSSGCQTSHQKQVVASAAPPEHSSLSVETPTVPCKEKLNTKYVDENFGVPGRHTSQEHTNYVAANMGQQANRHKPRKPLTEHSLSEILYSEFTALVAANENQQQFLLQLFENLKQVNSEQLRQGTLQALQDFLSQQQPSCNLSPNTSESAERQCLQSDSRSTENAAHEVLLPNFGEVYIKTEVSGCEELLDSEFEDNTEGATALPPRNAAWNNKDAFDLSMHVGCGTKLDWEVQAVLVDIIPFLKAHLDDVCTRSLVEAVQELVSHRPSASNLGGFTAAQLDALLEDTLLRFQGCRLRDIGEELLTAVAETLQSEVTYMRFVDTIRRDGEVAAESPVNESGAEASLSANNQKRAETVLPDSYNGDLAEADQTCCDECVDVEGIVQDPVAPADCSNEIDLAPANEGRGVIEEAQLNEDLSTEAEAQWEADQSLDQIPSRLLNSFHAADSSPP